MYIEYFYHFEFSNFRLKRIDNPSDYLIAYTRIDYVNVRRVFDDFYQVGWSILHLAVIIEGLFEHILYLRDQFRLFDEFMCQFHRFFKLFLGLEGENRFYCFIYTTIDVKLKCFVLFLFTTLSNFEVFSHSLDNLKF